MPFLIGATDGEACEFCLRRGEHGLEGIFSLGDHQATADVVVTDGNGIALDLHLLVGRAGDRDILLAVDIAQCPAERDALPTSCLFFG